MCLFCKIASGELSSKLVLDEADVVAFHDVNPQAPVHVLVVPRKHVVSLSDEAVDSVLLGKVLDASRRVASDMGLREGGYRVVFNTGAGAGQSVMHLHAHVLGGREFGWPPG